eukprot:CAMPEP_0113497756 /NCGR_PEP_ID=MMETSP0014_2-20120614/30795_1 /TAXON_ID=2857 /ORGANISM="Nitzschia sp." /LENGTH=1255 /DNA_ID=CAMNT_0000391707 /DNA_START=97 /DNA_END=3864 /DNA_ORIENTATION=+ /assembly_acc=CAM_ASM_000159
MAGTARTASGSSGTSSTVRPPLFHDDDDDDDDELELEEDDINFNDGNGVGNDGDSQSNLSKSDVRSLMSIDDGETTSHDSVSLSKSNGGAAMRRGRGRNNNDQDTRMVNCSKVTILLFLLLTAAATATLTYFLTSNSQSEQFQDEFDDYATEIVKVAGLNTENIFSTIQNMALTVTSHAEATNQTFPFVTVKHYEARAQQVLRLSGARYLSMTVRVDPLERADWESYSVQNTQWVQEGLDYQGTLAAAQPITPFIFKRDGFVVPADDLLDGQSILSSALSSLNFYDVTWMVAPAPQIPQQVNFDTLSDPGNLNLARQMDLQQTEMVTDLVVNTQDATDQIGRPQSFLSYPIRERVEDFDSSSAFASSSSSLVTATDNPIVGTLNALLPWDNSFKNILPDGAANGSLHLVLKNSCGKVLTYSIVGPNVVLLSGQEDVHDPKYDHLAVDGIIWDGGGSSVENGGNTTSARTNGYCNYYYTIYPTREFELTYYDNQPIYAMIGVLAIFLVTSLIFIFYDLFVAKRHNKIRETADRSNAIVSSLFPAQVRDRLMEGNDRGHNRQHKGNGMGAGTGGGSDKTSGTGNTATSSSLGGGGINDPSRPIADLFPSATVLFADIAGFTSWSSVREPSQVFILLETLYGAFDLIAKRLGIFKVETIGDCYVACCGLPEERVDHAVAISRFASQCIQKFNVIVKELEVHLGPGTDELALRAGLNSGPVTAGVLRGDKGRFQLFGDTVNTAARMESTGTRNRIQLSESTANLLIAAGKEDWISKRKDQVEAKGKGTLQTYWLVKYHSPSDGDRASQSKCSTSIDSHDDLIGRRQSVFHGRKNHSTRSHNNNNDEEHRRAQLKQDRLVEWNIQNLLAMLERIVEQRPTPSSSSSSKSSRSLLTSQKEEHKWLGRIATAEPRSEITDRITLKESRNSDQQGSQNTEPSDTVVVDEVAEQQLRDYVSTIANMYRPNHFHGFEHATHVAMSVQKLWSRIQTSDATVSNPRLDHLDGSAHDEGYQQQQCLYMLTGDPLVPFACVLSALVHDVDHEGVTNSTLVDEESEVAHQYNGKSVAEQHSIDLAWDLLMEDQYSDLRGLIYTSEDELVRFRQLVVNSVMATDIMDKELKEVRNDRWARSFSSSDVAGSDVKEPSSERATVVIDHLIQASDVAHTMQHWHIYLKWNEKFFAECYEAYKNGRVKNDPSVGWYKGEMGFFDFYIIPLAKKLKECGVFGVSGDEFLSYAAANRKEWEVKGESVVEGYLKKYGN